MDEQQDPSTTGLGRWLRRVLKPGDVYLDVGANVGAYVALASDLVGSTGRVYAIEPAPDNLARLHDRFGRLPNIAVVAAAAGERSGIATLHLDRRDGTRHSVAAGNVGKRGTTIHVRQLALDDLRTELTAVDVVKIDAQGAELHILRGARELLQRFQPALVLELWPYGLSQFGATPGEVLEHLDTCGYRVYRLSTEGHPKDISHVHRFLSVPGRWRNINIVAVPA